MWQQASRFVGEESGFLATTPWALVATVLMLGAVSGMAAFRHHALSGPPAPVKAAKAVK